VAPSQNIQKEKILAIFQNEKEPKGKAGKSTLGAKGANKSFALWQPGLLDHQAGVSQKDEWSFIEVTDTPFDKAWKPKSPTIFSEGTIQRGGFISENDIPMILEQARLQAEEIILAAQAEADDVLLQVQSEIDEQKKEGYQQGRNEAHAEIENTMKAVRIMIEEVEVWKTEFMSEGEQILVEMLKDISRKMFGDGAKLDSQTLHTNLNRIMENARGLGVLKIFLNPNDAKLLDPSWGEQQMLSLGEQVKIVASGNILPGGCLIKGNIGTVDGRVETQLDTILKTFDEPNMSAE
jgi:flagellar biosynthesis/type III secretory pathway protein FliH